MATFTIDDIARVVHEANRGLQALHGDAAPSPSWDEASEHQRASCLEGVRDALSGSTAQELHEDWCAHLRELGWTHGSVKDEAAKTHPCLVPFDELPVQQRAKDLVFVAIVEAMKDL